MIIRLHFPAVIVAALVAMLTVPAGALADSPVSLSAPELPGSPSVTVTPDSNGVGVDLGAGDTGLHAGAGPGGVSVTKENRGSSPSKPKGSDSAPVIGPVLKPAPRPPATEAGFGGGEGATIFGPPTSGLAPAAGNRAGGSRGVRSTNRLDAAKRRNGGTVGDDQKEPTRPWPFFEIVRSVPGEIAAAVTLLGLIALALWLGWARNRRRLSENAFVDPVTGIANAAAFGPVLDRELDRARRYKRPLGLLLLEVSEVDREDGKRLHLLDTRVRETSNAISAEFREGDTVGRLGHDRFGVICPEATAASVETLARAVEQRLEALRIHVNVGVAEREATDLRADDLVARATTAIEDRQPRRGKGSKLRLLRAA